MTTSLSEIEQLAATYANACQQMDEALSGLKAKLDQVKNERMRPLKRLANVVADREAKLHAAIESAPELFKKPRTVLFHGIKCGFSTSTGKVVWDDEDQVKKLIRRHLKDQEDILIKTVETVSRDAIRNLDPADRARIACRMEGAGDVVVLKNQDGEIEKLFAKLTQRMVDAILEPDQEAA